MVYKIARARQDRAQLCCCSAVRAILLFLPFPFPRGGLGFHDFQSCSFLIHITPAIVCL